MSDIRSLTDANCKDALSVMAQCFSANISHVLYREMRNPLRKEGDAFGDVAYENGKPVCAQVFVVRNFYVGSKKYIGYNAGSTCLLAGSPVEALIDIKAAGDRFRGGSVLKFSNTCSYESYRMCKKVRNTHIGVDSCARYMRRIVRPFGCVWYFLCKKIFKINIKSESKFHALVAQEYCGRVGNCRILRVTDVEANFFDTIMNRHLLSNKGLFCSRTAEEIEWIFGDRIRNGELVMLGAFVNNQPEGYIVLKNSKGGRIWYVGDWFAVSNNEQVLVALLEAACKYVRKYTPALVFEMCGFPMWVQPLIKRYFPYSRNLKNNMFLWKAKDKEVESIIAPVINAKGSWFFGPYDGDMCLCD